MFKGALQGLGLGLILGLGSFAQGAIEEEGGGLGSEMIVEVKSKKRITQSTASTSHSEVDHQQIARLPQGGEVSLPKLIATTTPGVVQGAFGQTFIRGNHANVQYQLDGVQLPDSPSNTFGQAVSPRNIDHMEIITGGIPAEYGQRLSAVVNVVTKSGAEKTEGEIELNYGSYHTISPHLLYGGSNESGTLHYFISGNYNRTDRGLDTPAPGGTAKSDQSQGSTESVHNLAVGTSEFAKVDWQVDNRNKISFILFFSQSDFQIPNFPTSFSSADPYFNSGYRDYFGNSQGPLSPTFNYAPSSTHDTQAEINTYSQVVWKHTFSGRSFFQLAPYYKYSLIVNKNDPANDFFAETAISGATPSSFSQNRHTNNLGLKADYTLREGQDHLIKVGCQLQASRSDGVISIQTQSSIPPMTDSSPNLGYFQGIYMQDDYSLAQSLVLNAGLRFDAAQFSFGSLSSTDSMLQPRVGLNYRATETTTLHVFYGKLFQPAPVENLRYQFDPIRGRLVSLSSYDIKAEKDDYYEAGVAQQILGTQVASLNVYYKDGVNVLDDFQFLNTPIAQPYNFSTGFAYGVELSLKGRVTEDWSDYFNYSYSIAMGQDIHSVAGESGPGYQMLDHVQVHTANGGLTYVKNNFWWTGQMLLGSGLRTGQFNSINLPSHFTADTTVGYQFRGSHFLSDFKISFDVLNILDNRYPITIANGFNGSHYAPGRQLFVRLAKNF